MSNPTTPAVHYKWKEIGDLPEGIASLRDRELESLTLAWDKQKATIEDQSQIKNFNEQLAREWSIETGIIEGVYTLDRGITQTLIERGINASYIVRDLTNRDPDLVARIIQTHRDVLEGLFVFVTGERELSTSYIKELHSALLRYQEKIEVVDQLGRELEVPLERGSYKKLPNNPTRNDGTTHEYCPPEHVSSEMDRLIDLHRRHKHEKEYCHIEAAWIHHAFTQVHPFQDGNGRVARALASLIFIRQGLFPLVVTRGDHPRYIEALELADQGDLSMLVRLFSQLQKRVLTRAIGTAVEAKPVKSLEEAIQVTGELLVDLGRIVPAEYQAAKDSAGVLVAVTANRLSQLNEGLATKIGRVNAGYTFVRGELGGPPTAELDLIAKTLSYDPNTSEYHQTTITTLGAPSASSTILVSFHGVGAGFRGLLVVVAYFRDGNGRVTPLSDDIFRISYQEPRVEIEVRYREWLDNCLIAALALWRRELA